MRGVKRGFIFCVLFGIFCCSGSRMQLFNNEAFADSVDEQAENIYAELWRWDDIDAYETKNLYTKVELTKKMLDEQGCQKSAEMVYAKLSSRPKGAKALFIGADLVEEIAKGNGNDQKAYIWWDQGTNTVKNYLEGFLVEYNKLGGTLDMIYSDLEKTNTNWGLTNPNCFGYNEKELNTFLKQVVETDSRYQTLRKALADRGFLFKKDVDTDTELLGVIRWNNAQFRYSYLIWNSVMENMRSSYVNEAIYYPAKKYYPNVKYSNYQDVALDPAIDFGAYNKPTFLGGTKLNPGTHSSPEAYPRDIFSIMSGNRDSIQAFSIPFTPYNSMLYHTNKIKATLLATKDKRIMPWVSTQSFREIKLLGDSPYYHEYFLHVGLMNPDPFLVFGPQYYGTDNAKIVENSGVLVNNLLLELNELVGTADRSTLVEDLSPWQDGYVLSGMYANNRNIYRITPDLSKVDTLAAFLSNKEKCEFTVGNKKISFPNGKILANKASSYGYWISTDPTVKPIIENINNT